MGGRGSGRVAGHAGKCLAEDALPLDIRRLTRDGVLTPGRSFSWQWMTNGRTVASIYVKPEAWSLTLSYSFTRHGQPAENINQTIALETTPCTFGGSRSWFRCPACCRRVAVIYGAGRHFACRLCKRLAYGSQNEDEHDRALRRANGIRKDLGWAPGVIHGLGPKPPGMHWSTFHRLCHQHDTLASASLMGMAERLGILRGRLQVIGGDVDLDDESVSQSSAPTNLPRRLPRKRRGP